MTGLTQPIVYRGMTANQVAEGFDDSLTIPNLYSLLQENRERGKIEKDKLKPFDELSYGNAPLQKLDIYAPKNAKQLPVLIDIHGGGWAWGSKNPRSIPAEAILSQDIIWVPIDYGLAPHYTMQQILSDVRAAISWVYQNISEYGGDPSRIFVTGQSSGAHLAATLLMPDWHKAFNVPENVIKGVIALSGIYDLDSLIYATKNEVQDILKITPEEARACSPIYHISKSDTPIIIGYGDKEPLAYIREAQDYANELKKNGFAVTSIVVPNANHFDMINALADSHSELFQNLIKMIIPDTIWLTDYNDQWPSMAQSEISNLQSFLPSTHIIDIQHVGSTAIPGMIAKPIIDIQIAVDTLEPIRETLIKVLSDHEYIYWADNPDHERMFFVKGLPPYGKGRTHHVHIVEVSNHHWREKILFRDYLIANPEAATRYADLKIALSKKHMNDREQYTEAKTDFVREILNQAEKHQI